MIATIVAAAIANPAAVALSVGLIAGFALGAVWGYRLHDTLDQHSHS